MYNIYNIYMSMSMSMSMSIYIYVLKNIRGAGDCIACDCMTTCMYRYFVMTLKCVTLRNSG